MGGFFAVASRQDCVADLFYGTDYHSHLGTRRGGIAVQNRDGFTRFIHDLTHAPFRSKFEDDVAQMRGRRGIGVISDFEDQPLIIGSHLGRLCDCDRRQDLERRGTREPGLPAPHDAFLGHGRRDQSH